MNRIEIVKRIDSLVGRAISLPAKRLYRPRARAGEGLNSFLIIRPGGIGDAVLLIPVIAKLKKRYPNAVIDVLAEKRNGAVFALCPDVSNLYRYDAPREFISALRNSYDVVIDTEQWHRLSAVAARLTRAPMSIGFATNERKELFTHAIPYSHDDYEVNSFLHLVEPCGVVAGFDLQVPFLSIGAELQDRATRLLHGLSGRRMVAIFPGGSIRERKWGNSRFHQTAKRLSDDGCGIVVVGGRDDRDEGREIIAGLPDAVNLCGTLSLPETAAVLAQTELLISGDSGIMHIGYGLGIKIIGLFGPGREKKWAPQSSRVAILNKHLACSPCTSFGYTPRCPINAACMKEITVDEVVAKAGELLNP